MTRFGFFCCYQKQTKPKKTRLPSTSPRIIVKSSSSEKEGLKSKNEKTKNGNNKSNKNETINKQQSFSFSNSLQTDEYETNRQIVIKVTPRKQISNIKQNNNLIYHKRHNSFRKVSSNGDIINHSSGYYTNVKLKTPKKQKQKISKDYTNVKLINDDTKSLMSERKAQNSVIAYLSESGDSEELYNQNI